MISALEIRGLRGIREASLTGLRPLTIFLGRNGCGKSTILEAAGVACSGVYASNAFAAMAAREWLGLAGMDFWWDAKNGATVTSEFDPSPSPPGLPAQFIPVKFTTKLQRGGLDAGLVQIARDAGQKGDLGGVQVTVSVQADRSTPAAQRIDVQVGFGAAIVNDDGYAGWQRAAPEFSLSPYAFQGTFADRRAGARMRFEAPRFSSALREALTAIKLTPWYDDFVEYMRDLRPRLDTIESIAVGDRDEPFVFEREPRVHYPMAYAGDGFRRGLLLASTLAEAKSGVAALDEPEAFEHPSMFPALTRLFRRALADGTQVLVATHSMEFVRAVLQELGDEGSAAAVVGLNLDGGIMKSTVASGPDVHRRVVELGDDLRL